MVKKQEYECMTCEDTGEVSAMENVYGSPEHAAPVGMQRCPDCRTDDEDDRVNE